jgi:hypothetical protein
MVLRKLNLRLKPELRFSFNVVHMHMGSEFLPREEEKPKTFLSEDCRAYEDILHPSRDSGCDQSLHSWSASR